jgi:hypothetical protein
MMKHIAVVLNSVTQADSMAPYLFSVARPGTRIVFLIPTKASKSVWLQARMTALVSQNSLAVEVCERQWDFETNHEKRAAEQKLEALRLALLRQGAETEIWIYTGSVRKPLKRMEQSHPGSFAVLRPRKEWLAQQLVRPILTRVGLSLTNGPARALLAFGGGGRTASWARTDDIDVK